MVCRRFLWVAVLGAAALFVAATAAAAPKVVRVPAKYVNAADGALLFESYCAACHGVTARGNGPAAALLGQAVPDLTLVTLRDGSFAPLHMVYSHLQKERPDSEGMIEVHQILLGTYHSEAMAQLAETNLIRHLESMQRTQMTAADK